MTNIPSLSWLADLNVYAVNRLPAHSDHVYYETMEDAENFNEMQMRYSLNGNWKFHFTNQPEARPKNFHRLDFNCDYWNQISVPGHIQLQGYGKPQYVNKMYPWDGTEDIYPPEVPTYENSVGSYITYFTVPDHFVGKPVYISFQGVESAFYVWLNGQFIGYSEDSFTPAEFDLTPFLNGSENKLAVEVYQRSTGSWLEDQDFWRFSGIFRDVYLYSIPEIHVTDLDIQANLDSTYKKGTLIANGQFHNPIHKDVKMIAELYCREGKLIDTVKDEFSNQNWTLKLEVNQPHLWSAEIPNLYKLFIKLYNHEGQLIEVIPQKVGFRRFEMIDNIMKINGKRIVFKGVNRHEFNCRTGRVISKQDMIWDIQTMKQNNINAVRTSHYPNNSEWYDLCDEYGLYVIDEMNLETHGSWEKIGKVDPTWNIPRNKQEWENIVMDRAVSMYERDKNHPSIIIWSCGNESYAGEIILNVSKYFKSVDSSRLVHYEGVFYDRNYEETSDMESRMYAKPADIEAYLTNNPRKPYISCEYIHAMGNSLGGMYKYTDLEQKYEMYQGGFIWDFIDQAIIKKDRFGQEFLSYGGDFDDRPTDYGFCTNGIVYADRKLSPKMQEVKFLYQNFKLLVSEKKLTIKNDSLFTNTSAYDLVISLHYEGKELYCYTEQVAIEPQNDYEMDLYFLPTLMNLPGEYCINTSFTLRESTIWADAGHEIAFGQYIFKRTSNLEKMITEKKREMRIVHGDFNIGVHGEDFSILFSKQSGTLISVKYSGREMIAIPPAPLFWRATTDNDRGFFQGYESGLWFAASLARKCIDIETIEEDNYMSISFSYKFSISSKMNVQSIYKVSTNGNIQVKSIYNGSEHLPPLPIFALTFKIPADYHMLEWFAFGPEENYEDRSKGARLGIFKNTVKENVSEYVMPQESGNRTGVRWVKITNPTGQGVKISTIDKPVECNISPYTAFEIESAAHHYELPNVHYTVITVARRQMGVGGDDSWGAPVQKNHIIEADQQMEFEFMLERLD